MLGVSCCVLLSVIAQPRPAPTFAVHSTAAAPVVGKVKSLTTDGALAIVESSTAVSAGNLVSLRRTDRPLPTWPRGPQVLLTNGDRLAAETVGGSADDLDISLKEHRTVWSVPIASLAAVWVVAPPADTPIDPTNYAWAAGAARRDAVLLRNGDVLRGVVEGFTEKPAVRLKIGTDVQAIELTRVAAVAFDPSLARPRKPKGSYTRLTITDGTRVSLRTATSDGVTLKAETLFGGKLDLPLSDVAALDVLLGKATYLSDLKPKAATTEPFLGVAWPWQPDRSAHRAPLRLRTATGESTFDKGIGTHSKTTLTFTVAAKHRRFEALVDLDAVSGRKGAVAVRVLLDGQPAWRNDRLSSADGPQAVSVELTGAKELTLIVDYGPGGDVQDDVNWCDARLIE